jgi:hypothetical protein
MIEWLKNFYSEEKLNILTEEKLKYLYSKTQPKRVKITDMEGVPVASYRVNSADGFVMPYEWRTKGIKKCVTLVTVTGKRLTMSSDHLIEMNTGLWKYAVFIIAGEKVITKDGVEEVSEITYAGENVVYDFHIAHENHRYYTNDISSHNSGSGKSLVMMNIALNWLQMGLSGVYITLELSEELTSLRTDAMLTNMSTKDIRRDMDTAELKVKMLAKKSGQYRVKGLPAQSNVNDIRAYLKEVQIQTGIKIDFVMIDYLDLVMPVSVKVNPNDQFIKDKYVSEELRNLAKELGILMVTASQLNRCLTLDTVVNINGRDAPIGSVKVGDILSSDNGSVTVTEVLPITPQAVYRITTKSGKTIECSAKHLFPSSAGLRSLENGLQIGDKLYSRGMENPTQNCNDNNTA